MIEDYTTLTFDERAAARRHVDRDVTWEQVVDLMCAAYEIAMLRTTSDAHRLALLIAIGRCSRPDDRQLTEAERVIRVLARSSDMLRDNRFLLHRLARKLGGLRYGSVHRNQLTDNT